MHSFEGVDKAQPAVERLPKLTPGEYLLEVVENKVIQAQNGDAVVRSFKIKESIGEGALPAGTEAAAKLLYFSDKYVGARIAEYVRGLTNTDRPTSKMADEIFGPTNPAKGKLVRTRVYQHKAQNGRDYMRYDWRYVADDD